MKILENIAYINDGLDEHKLDIIYPEGQKAAYPFIINIHGGSFSMLSKDRFYRTYGLKLAKGEFAVVNINYGLVPRYTFPSQLKDVLDAIKFMEENGKKQALDCENMYISGDSAGGYLAAMAACVLNNRELKVKYELETEMKCRAVALNSAMFDFNTFMDKDIVFPMKRGIIEGLFGTKDFENHPYFKFSSVIDNVNWDFPPAYIMDTQVGSFEKEAINLSNTLKKHKVEHRLRIFPKEENLIHAFNVSGRYPQCDVVIDEILEFFSSKLEKDNEN